jgi:amidophosphoribosyltransferase
MGPLSEETANQEAGDEMLLDKPHDECGIFGIYAPNEDVARLTFFALFALQHRGQESAGIAVSDGRVAHIYKAMGLVSQVFNEDNLAPLRGYLAIGHTRYSTTGSSNLRNAQPYLIESLNGPIGVAHNGNLVNAPSLRRDLLQRGVGLTSSSDSEVMTLMLAGAHGETFVDRIADAMQYWHGAYAVVILTRNAMYALRDPWGFRPLVIGRLASGGYCVASETCALDTIGAEHLREVEPGEIVTLDEYGMESYQAVYPQPPALCTFEHIYFSRPDSTWGGQVIHLIRQRLGRALAREAPVDVDFIVPVPDSSTPAAIGYALESGIPYNEALIKNRYIGRTFIQPDNALRRKGVALKFNPLPENLEGKRVVLVDDSIVRGNTSGPLVRLLRNAGVAEVHMRVTCPPIRHPCFMGVDMATYDELIAHRMTVEQIRDYIGADSLHYLSVEGMMAAIGRGDGYCNACFTGSYPLTLEENDKQVFEGVFGH